MSYQLEQKIIEGIATALKDNLQDEFDEVELDYPAPDETNGYTDEVTITSRNSSNEINVWCDSMVTLGPNDQIPFISGAQSVGFVYERGVFGILYTFSVPRDQMGSHKRKASEAIRRVLYGRFHQAIPGAVNMILTSHYRFGTDRMQGGSRVGLRGAIKETGDLKDSLVIGIQADLKVRLSRFGPVVIAP